MNDTAHFKVFCLEIYKNKHQLTGNKAFRLFKDYDVLGYLGSFYDVLHSLGDTYIVACIDEYIDNHQACLHVPNPVDKYIS